MVPLQTIVNKSDEYDDKPAKPKRKVYTKEEQMTRTLDALRAGCNLTVLNRDKWTCLLTGPNGEQDKKRTEKRYVRKYVFAALKRDDAIELCAGQPDMFGEVDKIYRLKIKIESDTQRAVSAQALENLKRGLAALDETEDDGSLLRTAQREALTSMIEEIEGDLQVYDARNKVDAIL